jgi:hypothetical protein
LEKKAKVNLELPFQSKYKGGVLPDAISEIYPVFLIFGSYLAINVPHSCRVGFTMALWEEPGG